jgi:hypothetical protein
VGGARPGRLLQPDEFGDVFHSVNDVPELARFAEHGGVQGAPVPGLERAVGLANVVFLERHRVGHSLLTHAIERRPQVPRAGRLGILGVVRERFEDASSDELCARRHRGAQICLGHPDDAEVRREHEK